MRLFAYDRKAAVDYAERWALGRNPDYYNFDALGGDCTNFASQCLYAGCRVMNDSENGWYYHGLNRRSPSWTGVSFFYDFLINHHGAGPFALQVSSDKIEPGDFIQLGNGVTFYHTLVVLDAGLRRINVAAHSQDALARPLSSYSFETARFLHIVSARDV